MANSAHITRRTAFASIGAALSCVAIAIPSVAAVKSRPQAGTLQITAEQGAAIEEWRRVLDASNAQWDAYMASHRGGSSSDVAYHKWRDLNAARENAQLAMMQALSPNT